MLNMRNLSSRDLLTLILTRVAAASGTHQCFLLLLISFKALVNDQLTLSHHQTCLNHILMMTELCLKIPCVPKGFTLSSKGNLYCRLPGKRI